ncbi:hypothetical protein ZWY2020_057146 [Hordeum vulgare]|nr:hypothetical protein ZWY2020_057146 [Hordeum vulgare]
MDLSALPAEEKRRLVQSFWNRQYDQREISEAKIAADQEPDVQSNNCNNMPATVPRSTSPRPASPPAPVLDHNKLILNMFSEKTTVVTYLVAPVMMEASIVAKLVWSLGEQRDVESTQTHLASDYHLIVCALRRPLPACLKGGIGER